LPIFEKEVLFDGFRPDGRRDIFVRRRAIFTKKGRKEVKGDTSASLSAGVEFRSREMEEGRKERVVLPTKEGFSSPVRPYAI
jgi:hypothetical protein